MREPVPSLVTHLKSVRRYIMGAAIMVVKKKYEWNPMAGEERMEKDRDMEGEGKGYGHCRF